MIDSEDFPKDDGLQRDGLRSAESIESNAKDDYNSYVDPCGCGFDALQNKKTTGDDNQRQPRPKSIDESLE